MQDWAAHSAIGKSGFLAAFSLIFISELGDKTFFLAGLLALKVHCLLMSIGTDIKIYSSFAALLDRPTHIIVFIIWQVGRLISFLGSTAALSLMTVISVTIGFCFKSVPDALKSSVPIGQYLSVACMLYFGVRTIKVLHFTARYLSTCNLCL